MKYNNVMQSLLALALISFSSAYSEQINIFDNYVVPGYTGEDAFRMSNQYNPISICRNPECTDRFDIIYGQMKTIIEGGSIFVKVPDGADYVFQGRRENEFYTAINVSSGIWNVSIQPRSNVPAGVTPVAMTR